LPPCQPNLALSLGEQIKSLAGTPVNATKLNIMNPIRKAIVYEPNTHPGITGAVWALARGAIRSVPGAFLGILAIGPIVGLDLIPAGRLNAQTFNAMHSFTAAPFNTNSDGAIPYAGLTLGGNSNTWYGTASLGGSSGQGTVFAVNTDGTGFTILHSFTGGSDGATPWAGLTLSGNTLYGTTYYGGASSNGTVFAINTDGTGYTILHSFTAHDASNINIDGAYPNAGLILLDNTLYGTASQGGGSGYGNVFGINTDGTGFTNLHSFAYIDGSDPVAGLTLSGHTLYGTATYGGSWGNGTVFAINTDSTGFTVLHSFQPVQLVLACSNGSCPCGYSCINVGYGFPICVYSYNCNPFPPPWRPPPCAGFCGGG